MASAYEIDPLSDYPVANHWPGAGHWRSIGGSKALRHGRNPSRAGLAARRAIDHHRPHDRWKGRTPPRPLRPTEPAEMPADDVVPAAELLARVEPLPYPLRMRELALHARRLAGTPRLSDLLDDLFA